MLERRKKVLKAQTILWLACMLCLYCANAVAQSDDVLQHFEQVAALIQSNRLAEAEKELTEVLRVAPNMPVATGTPSLAIELANCS